MHTSFRGSVLATQALVECSILLIGHEIDSPVEQQLEEQICLWAGIVVCRLDLIGQCLRLDVVHSLPPFLVSRCRLADAPGGNDSFFVPSPGESECLAGSCTLAHRLTTDETFSVIPRVILCCVLV
jgi:hypothetical protein